MAERMPMKSSFAKRFGYWSLLLMLFWVGPRCAQADPIPVRNVRGTLHGFLEMLSEDGRVVATGDIVQVVHGERVISRTLFNFEDGSIDDETTVFTQHRTFQLISDHHVQKGPSFPHPMDVLIDSRSGQVTVRSTGKDGKEEVKTDHIVLPPDLANGIVPIVVENMRSDAPETKVSMLVTTPKLRLVKLAISNHGEEACSLAGSPLKAIRYEIKIELGSVAGLVAPFIGKEPPNIRLWTIGEQAPTFVREQGPLYLEGPLMTIQLASPVWPKLPKAGE